MGRRSLWVATAVITATMAWVSGAPANGTRCGIPRARVVKEARAALIVRKRGEWGRYYGCLKTLGRPVLVAREYYTDDGDEYLFSDEYLRLRGRFAAVPMAGCLEGCALAEIAIWDLQTGVRVRLAADLKGVGDYPLRVMLSRRGALAYVAEHFRRVLVVKADAGGHAVVKRGLSRHLPPSSVRLRGNRLSWRFKGERQSVRLR